MIDKINEFLRTRKAKLESFEVFEQTGLYEHYANVFGPLIYVEDTKYDFIGVDAEGWMYDEFYYPYPGIKKIGTIIPEHLYFQDISPQIPDPFWESVANKGYAVIDSVELDDELIYSAENEGYIPYGFNEALNMSKSIYHPYFATLMDYKNPEQHKTPDYIPKITEQILKQIPSAQPLVDHWALHTADLIKYLYMPDDPNCTKGPYSFHMDYFPRALYMFFLYTAKDPKIEGRELLVGQRKDFTNFDREALDMSPGVQPVVDNPFQKLPDSDILNYDRIEIGHKKVIVMNTLNPMFVHRVEKLRAENEITFICSYLWCKIRIPKD
jgi:hypothetical protein